MFRLLTSNRAIFAFITTSKVLIPSTTFAGVILQLSRVINADIFFQFLHAEINMTLNTELGSIVLLFIRVELTS